jgi:hypothetical protein
MTRLALAFDPVLPWEIIAALGGLLLWSSGACLAAHARHGFAPARLRPLVLALTNPVLQREEREGLPAVVALVVDESAASGSATERRKRTGDRGG